MSDFQSDRQAIPAAISEGPKSVLIGQSSVPPHPLDGQWYVHAEGQTYGPYTGHDIAEFIKAGRITAASDVVRAGTEQWTKAIDDSRLVSLFKGTGTQSSNPPPITAAPGATVVQVTNQIAPHPMMFMDASGEFGPKSPGVALVLSFFICGAGQMYCGKVGKGILMLIGCIALWFVLLGWIVWIWSMIDAYSTAKSMNLRYLFMLQQRHGS